MKIFLFCFFFGHSLLAQLNSAYDEQAPVLSPNGKELYFTIAHHPTNISGKRDAGDIWVSKQQDGKWSAPTLAKGSINNSGYNAVLGFSPNGQEMFLYGHYDSNGGATSSQGISVSSWSSEGWSIPRNETVPYFLNKSVATGGYITPGKSVFVFSAESRDTYGNEDIYVSFNNGIEWTEPKNLGPTISSRFQELTPWLSADTKTIFFSSNNPSTLGSFDVFSADRLDDSWTNWSPPKNLGPAVNSNGSELNYHLFSEHIFFTSTYNSDGYGDINKIPLDRTPSLKPDESLNRADTVDRIVSPASSKENPMNLFGRVTNSVTGQGVTSKMIFHSSTSANATSAADGHYSINLNPNLLYSVRIESAGYIGFFDKVDLTNRSVQQLEINFKLQPVVVGISINLRSVLFKQSLPELRPESSDELDMVVEFLKTNPTVEIELAGHTDNSGNSKLNLKLSRDRVARVKNYLTEKGIAAKRIKGIGYGGSKPITSNKTEEGKQLNRRVEFRIVKE